MVSVGWYGCVISGQHQYVGMTLSASATHAASTLTATACKRQALPCSNDDLDWQRSMLAPWHDHPDRNQLLLRGDRQ